MKVAEIKLAVYNAIDLLQSAKVGSGPMTERAARKQQAHEILESLPKKWWRRLSEKDSDMIVGALTDVV